jgi:hypothetical protein
MTQWRQIYNPLHMVLFFARRTTRAGQTRLAKGLIPVSRPRQRCLVLPLWQERQTQCISTQLFSTEEAPMAGGGGYQFASQRSWSLSPARLRSLPPLLQLLPLFKVAALKDRGRPPRAHGTDSELQRLGVTDLGGVHNMCKSGERMHWQRRTKPGWLTKIQRRQAAYRHWQRERGSRRSCRGRMLLWEHEMERPE